MLSDFLTLELYFGSQNSALYFEDLAQKYGTEQLKNAVNSGDIQCRSLCFGSDCGRVMAWLSEQGRHKAQS